MIDHDATQSGWHVNPRARFEVAAPRHFLLPAILLLLAEEPRHGYGLAKGVRTLQIGRVDRPSVYRALAQLEADGLVTSSADDPPAAQGRRVYTLSAEGERALRHWMGVIKVERDGLDRVLRRYVATGTVEALLAEVEGGWHPVTARSWSSVSTTSAVERPSGSLLSMLPESTTHAHHEVADHDAMMHRFRVVADRSAVMINARSSVGPITFGAIGVNGVVEAAISGQQVHTQPAPVAHLVLDVELLRSGNTLYDAELMRRIDARRHRQVQIELTTCTALGGSTRFHVAGLVTFHGVSRALDGTVAVTMPSPRRLLVRGEQLVDIRDFGVSSPTVLMLRIYPDVEVGVQIEAELEDPTSEDDG